MNISGSLNVISCACTVRISVVFPLSSRSAKQLPSCAMGAIAHSTKGQGNE